MLEKNIQTLRDVFPNLFDIKVVPKDWHDDLHVIDRYDNYPDPFEGELFPEENEPIADIPDIPLGELDEMLSEPQIIDDIGADAEILSNSVEKLQDIFGNDFPGAPQKPKGAGRVTATETYGFYLPWHNFEVDTWGIYIFAEGIVILGNLFNQFTNGLLPMKESNLLARAFIFHHEAYHNKVETFASRFETALRQPMFISAIAQLYISNGFSTTTTSGTLPQGIFHEESLANAYAYQKCDNVFSRYPNKQKEFLKKLARHAIYQLISQSPPKYREAMFLIPNPRNKGRMSSSMQNSKRFINEVEGFFQEEALARTTNQTFIDPKIWQTQKKLMDPSLRRNCSFTYLINKKSKLARRSKLAVHYLARRKLIKILEQETGGHMENRGGSHPSKFRVGNLKIPIPGNRNREIPKGTAEKIFKIAGIKKNIEKLI